MRRILIGTLALTALVYPATLAAGPTKKPKTHCTLHAKLKPSNEVRAAGTTDPVESHATGKATIKVTRNGVVRFKFHIKNKGREEFMAGHIHQAPAGSNGPIVAFLFSGPATTAKHLKGKGTTTFVAGSNLTGADLCANPAGFYVNFHTAKDPEGATRGQLRG